MSGQPAKIAYTALTVYLRPISDHGLSFTLVIHEETIQQVANSFPPE
jgi:hypothetical protein